MEANETLFEGQVPMVIQQGDAGHQLSLAGHHSSMAGLHHHHHNNQVGLAGAQTFTMITVRMDLAKVHTPQPRRILHVQLTDEADPFFFYSLDITEEDFQGLKNEQNLKPDFINFPSKIIELFQHCIACAKEKFPSYTAELTMRGTGQGQGGLMQGQGQLQLIKTDDFKNLVTLALVLRAGTDMAVKKHLASQLIAFKSLSSSLRVQLDESQASLSKRAEVAERRAAELGRALDERVNDSNRIIGEIRTEMVSQVAMEREKTLLSSQEITRKADDEKKSIVANYESKNAALLQTIHRLEGENKDLLDTRYRLEADVKDLTAQLHATKVDLSHCKQELTSLRAENKALDGAIQEQEKNVNGHRIKISAVEQHISDKDDLLSKMSALLDSTNAQKASVEESLNLVKANLKEAEERMSTLRSEIKKGNQIIATLQTALKASKSKSTKKTDLVTKLQAELVNKDSHINSLQGEIAKAQAQKETSQHEIDILRETEAALKKRLEDCKEIISNNNNVIEFLQKDLLLKKQGALLPPSSSPSYSSSLPSSSMPSSTPASVLSSSLGYTLPSGQPSSATEGLASTSTSAYKFRPKYTSSRSLGYLPTTNPAVPNISSLNLNSTLPTSSYSIANHQNTPTTVPTTQMNNTPSSHFTSQTNNTPSTPPARPNTPKSVLYNPPASQRRSFVQ